MKIATVSASFTRAPPGYAWCWCCSAEGTSSTRLFTYYYDCVSDARTHGYHVEIAKAHGNMAPDGGYALPVGRY